MTLLSHPQHRREQAAYMQLQRPRMDSELGTALGAP